LLLALFWLSAVGIVYAYVGYGLLIALLARWRRRPVRQADITPRLTVLIAAYNEQGCIAHKLDNTLSLDYPAAQLEVLVVADGSNDDTAAIVAAYAARDPRVRLLHQSERQGKPAALIRAFPQTTGEVIVFTDANCFFAPDALRMLVRNLADPTVGGVGGEKQVASADGSLTGRGEGLYWRYESFLKACDSAVSSVMGVPGEIWAARRSAYVPPDRDSYIEDFVASLRMVAAGWRVVHEAQAQAYEEASPGLRSEWIRRTRMAAGGWQAFFQLPGMLRHPQRWVTWQYLSHRMMRWMLAPSLFILALLANLGLALLGSRTYAALLGIQVLFYLLAALGGILEMRNVRLKGLYVPFYICLLNAAALVGGWRYLTGRQSVVWKKAR
jgi:cellulose synthase/poly-beta-1,6-N-acetylglucosamine synthase-like glycosyltransferase